MKLSRAGLVFLATQSDLLSQFDPKALRVVQDGPTRIELHDPATMARIGKAGESAVKTLRPRFTAGIE